MSEQSNELLQADIQRIKQDIDEIKMKLDTKYVSHETFDLSIQALNLAISWIVKAGIFIATPIYGAVIILLFKMFTS
jgi:hypothetical protein